MKVLITHQYVFTVEDEQAAAEILLRLSEAAKKGFARALRDADVTKEQVDELAVVLPPFVTIIPDAVMAV